MSLDMEEALDPRSTRTDSSMRTFRGLARLRELLEKECDAQVGLDLNFHHLVKAIFFRALGGIFRTLKAQTQTQHACVRGLAKLRKQCKAQVGIS